MTVALAPGPVWEPWPPVAFTTARLAAEVARPLQFGFESVWIGTPTTSAPQPLPLAAFEVTYVESNCSPHALALPTV